MFVIEVKKIRRFLLPVLLVFVLLFFSLSLCKILMNEFVLATSGDSAFSRVIVVDAGHGEPDGGAVSYDGVKEATLNLQIALKLQDALLEEGFDVIMTREDENNIAAPDKQNSVREMKVSDIDHRIQIVNTSGADMLVSIHMNKFSASQYKRLADILSENI